VLEADEAEEMVARCRLRLERGESMILNPLPETDEPPSYPVDWKPYRDVDWTETAETAVSPERLADLAERLQRLPEGFELNARVGKIMKDRARMAAGELPIDWGFAETLAYAALVTEGYPVRLSGQDSGRGTFFHRHSVLHNQHERGTHVPLRKLDEGQANFLVIDSLLSEEAVLAFEYGYATAAPETLVIWEAQFGDFANGAQVVIDQFISSGETKWGRLCHLTLLLPHGYEGQGPEHSSARLERFMQLCAENNMQVCVPSTPAQAFHMLRRQMLRPYRKPLVVMSPKSLLRHKQAVSTLEDLTGGAFQPVIGEIEPIDTEAVRRIVMCSGKLYYDLVEKRREAGLGEVALLRIEQLYPFPEEALRGVIAGFPNAREFVWAQEEPLNQGAWYSSQHHMRRIVPQGAYLEHVTRPAAASPAVGHYDVHVAQQRAVVAQALGIDD
jgi:2-oxoglutarate dehydrogenase E1 component